MPPLRALKGAALMWVLVTTGPALAEEMEGAGVRAYCEEVARTQIERALKALDGVGLRDDPTEKLRVLARYLVERRE